MRRLNLVAVPRVRLEHAAPRPFHDISFGGARVFLDPGTLETFAAGSEDEAVPTTRGLEPVFPPPAARGPKALCLSLTHACDLRCRYCYVRAKGSQTATMSRDVARKALSLLRPPGPWRVGFFGGEPLLAWDLVREVTELAHERAERLGTRVAFSVTTNGTQVTHERAEFLARHGFSVILSLDGPRELHDSQRPTADGSGSFDLALAGLKAAADHGLGRRVTLRATFPLSRPELAARLEFLNALADEGLARAVSVEPAWPTMRDEGGRMKDEEGRPHPSAFCLPPFPEYLAAARWAASRIESGERLRFHHFEKALERVLLMKPAGTECGAGFGYVEVAPSGEIHACHKAAGGAVGHVECGISEGLRAKWLENRWYLRDTCAACWARNVCGGGCRAEAAEHTGSPSCVWPLQCAVKRLQVEASLYVAAICSQERLAAFLAPRLRRRRDAKSTTETQRQ